MYGKTNDRLMDWLVGQMDGRVDELVGWMNGQMDE